MDDSVNRMRQLIDELNDASEAYYGGQGELMSNYEWDQKFDELTALETSTGVVLDGSPTHKVSGESDDNHPGVASYPHEFPALSLPKSKNVSDLLKWAKGKPVNVSWKLDGMTLVVTWDNGHLTRILTRHDGITGYDITDLASAISNLPVEIPYKGHLVVRGEAEIDYSDFEEVNDIYGGVYDNPRNLVAGSLTPFIKSVDSIKDRRITWLPFKLVYFDWSCVDSAIALRFKRCPVSMFADKDGNIGISQLTSWKDRMEFLHCIGMKTVEAEYVENSDADLVKVIEKWSNRVDKCDHPVDGLVIGYDDMEYASEGTNTEHHNTREGFAFKWADETAETTLVDVEWSPSVNSINPVAIFESVRLEGTTVTRASLCNITEMQRLGIGGIGTKLTVIKSNKIIPKVVKATVPEGVEKTFEIPTKCPVCDCPVHRFLSTGGVESLRCENDDCPAKNLSKLVRFVGKYGFNIIGMSKQTLQKLMELKLIKNAYDILTLPDREADLRQTVDELKGWGEKTIKNLLRAITKARTVNAANLLYSLCIPMCGRDMAKRLTTVRKLDDIIATAESDANEGTDYILAGSDGIGDVKAGQFIDWFKSSANKELIANIVAKCNVVENFKEEKQSNGEGRCAGLTFVVTGKVNTFRSRDDIQQYIENEGGRFLSSVSHGVDYLVNNDVNSTSNKNMTAKKLGVPIISELEFREKFVN